MAYMDLYSHWMESPTFDAETKKELAAIAGNDKEIEDRFYRSLEFGTGGMRGVIGAGTNRMNRYTIRKATQGLANLIKSMVPDLANASAAIACDSRHMSPEFSEETALVLCANGIRAYLFESLRPTPELSFAVRHFRCSAGVMITASHNPKEYNGYKVYGNDGCQMPPKESDELLDEVNRIEDLSSIPIMSREDALEKGLLVLVGAEVDDAYIAALKTVCVNPALAREAGRDVRIIYTPLHGTGNIPVRRILSEIGFEHVMVVPEQELPDPDFSTVAYPNPEDKAAFTLAIALAKQEDVDLIVATDPDADRVGVVVRDDSGEYVTLNGNQTGCLLMEYILSQKQAAGKLPENGFVVKTIVTTELARKIADHYRVRLLDVLTGFKFIGEKIRLLDDTGKATYLFGFEESYGYLAGTHARDKDAVVAVMLIAEMHAWYRSKGKSLYEGLMDLYATYGHVLEGIDSFTLKGKEGLEKIGAAMNTLRAEKAPCFGGTRIRVLRDYETGTCIDFDTRIHTEMDFPASNVLHYDIGDGEWFCVRPSGTEPKIKIYYGICADSAAGAQARLLQLKTDVLGVIKPLLD